MPSQDHSTNWHGSFESNWENQETGERIEFRPTDDGIEIWVCSNNVKETSIDTPRGKLFDTKENRSEAIERAHEIAERLNTTRWYT